METYRYVNIFETKGLEYLLVVSFLASFVYFLRVLCAVEKRPGSAESQRVATADLRCPAGELCPFASGRNEWPEEVGQRRETGAA